jgi:hypothetical protein
MSDPQRSARANTIICKPEEYEATRIYAMMLAGLGIKRLVYLESEIKDADEMETMYKVLASRHKTKPNKNR